MRANSQSSKPDRPDSRKSEKPAKGQFSIPEGEVDDMKREYTRLSRKRRDLKPTPPK
jgi:hypothetical protein